MGSNPVEPRLPRAKMILLWALGVCAVCAAGFVLYRYDPAEGGIFFPPCPTEYLTHFYCPGCGTLRALHALLHGEFRAACSQNVLAVLAIPFLALLLLFPKKFRHPAVSATVLALVLLFAILRNLPAFACLAPH